MVISLSGGAKSLLQNQNITPIKMSITVLVYLRYVEGEGFMRTAASPEVQKWIDGFLFVANRTILDLLNTKPVLADVPTELLPDFRALERWLISSGTVTSPKAKAKLRSWRNSAEAAAFLKQLIAFREKLRETILRMESGLAPADAFLTQVNSL